MKTNFSKLESSLAIEKLSDSDLDTVVGGEGFFDGLKETYPYIYRMKDGCFTRVDVCSRRAKVGLGFGLALCCGYAALVLYGMYKLGNWLVRISEEKPVIKNKKNKNQSNDEV